MAELIPISFRDLLKRMWYEYGRTRSIFDLPERKFFRPTGDVDLSVSFCGNPAGNPLGPAAGPHTQLAQNIVLSWLSGSRIIELKTVQIKDELALTRPCIDMATIGYNTEWSQELRLDVSLREYIKASMIVELLKRWFRNRDTESGVTTRSDDTVFDISVGYDLAGIKSSRIRQWLLRMRNASGIVDEYRRELPDAFLPYRDIPFKSEIADSITLSTFHGTPADEIERICEFLLTEMDYHVIIKMNPPMLGRERVEYLLHDRLGYTDVEVNPEIFTTNITFSDAVEVVRRLQSVASRYGKTIGVKFGNTLEVLNRRKFLKDDVQYLSGQPLHILHLVLVEEWRRAFGGDFPISFSAGVDANNFADCVGIGLLPVTVCTDLLRPGGYGRLPLYLMNLERRMRAAGANSIDEFILRSGAPRQVPQPTDLTPELLKDSILRSTSELVRASVENPRYHAGQNRKLPRKIGRHLRLWDCINCDKCIPVCPNDANFYFEIEPIEIPYNNLRIVQNGWEDVPGGLFRLEASHQIATFADACNACGNCDVFCPEDGGPYLEKPLFFGSLEGWKKWNTLNGFVLGREGEHPVLYGRFGGVECELRHSDEEGTAAFRIGMIVVTLDLQTHHVVNVQHDGDELGSVIDMNLYFTMEALMKGMLNSSRVHYVNVGFLARGEVYG